MKPLSGSLIIVGIALCLSDWSTVVFAKVPDRSQAAISHQATNQTQILGQVNNTPDITLLAKVITAFLKGDVYQTESTMNVNAVIGNTTVASNAQIQTIVQFPNKFRTQVTFTKPGTSTQVKTLVISNGKQVWVYRPDLKQYAVSTYAKFDQLEDNYWIGFSTTVFAQTPPDVKKLVAQGALSDANVLKEVGLELGGLQGGTRTIDNQTFYAYEYKDAKAGYRFSAFVEPGTAALKQLQIAGKYEGSDITIVEQILRRVAIDPVNTNTFTFTPPRDTKKVNSVAIGPL